MADGFPHFDDSRPTSPGDQRPATNDGIGLGFDPAAGAFSHYIPAKMDPIQYAALDALGIPHAFDSTTSTTYLLLPVGASSVVLAGDTLVPFSIGLGGA